ncbi:MAG: nucleoside-diphosphate sugar epimerase/dehydratase, partial [Kiritimatiellae bacterium]|nr:nucleoside-diphosphate sugar epimerase/dehydratase [Kiritimatiellia bacterium]
IDYILCLGFLLGIRLSIRIFREEWKKTRSTFLVRQKRILIVGAGDVGETATRMLERDVETVYSIVGFLDDNKSKQSMMIRGYPILGGMDDAAKLVREHQVTDVLFAISNVPKQLVRQVIDSCEGEKLSFRILPVFHDILTGDTAMDNIRGIQLEDLLGREPAHLDTFIVKNDVTGRCVMVTGAGGSIGSELCRQVMSFSPSRIVLLDAAETPLFEIERELIALKRNDLEIIPALCSVTDEEGLDCLMRKWTPDIIYHAAAYKHVPMLEGHPLRAILNNVYGTMNLLNIAVRCGVKRLVMISTDKAVRPANVMGATKRLAEMLVSSVKAEKTVTTVVRFGNVLGSNGSVVPIFKKQLEAGGPITVTHPEMTRFFMTIPEAVELVLHAGSMGHGGEVYILDMGEPVKIVELARKMIKLSGKMEEVDIAIEFTGMRPGEKMYEELVAHGEEVLLTTVEKIKMHVSSAVDRVALLGEVEGLISLARRQDELAALNKLWALIQRYDHHSRTVDLLVDSHPSSAMEKPGAGL